MKRPLFFKPHAVLIEECVHTLKTDFVVNICDIEAEKLDIILCHSVSFR